MSRLLFYLFRESLYTKQFLFAITGQVLILAMADHALLRRHGRIPWICWSVGKVAVYYLWEIYFLQHPEISLDTFGPYRLFCVLRDLGSVILFIWTYHPEPVKAFLAIFLMEIVLTVITIPPLFLVNLMEHREEVFGIPGVFMPADLLIPVFTFLFWKLVRDERITTGFHPPDADTNL